VRRCRNFRPLLGSTGWAVVLLDGVADMIGYLSLRRHKPEQVQAVGGPFGH